MPDWNDVFQEIQNLQQQSLSVAEANKRAAASTVDSVRHKYLEQLFDYTDRNVIAYYSGWLSKPGIEQQEINDEDKNGFMMAVHDLDRDKGLDLILHTPGGVIASTQSLTDYLHQMFGDNIRAIIPQIAMSAGTMLACSCRSILMGKHSNIGPIDPQMNGIPAHGVIAEFRRACKEVKEDPSTADVWANIIRQYTPGFLGQCQNAIDWSEDFVRDQLKQVMFGPNGAPKKDGKPFTNQGAAQRVGQIVRKLSDYSDNKTHSRHIHVDECEQIGLNIERLEGDDKLQDLVLTVHHCYMHALMNTRSIKMIENHLGTAFVKQVRE